MMLSTPCAIACSASPSGSKGESEGMVGAGQRGGCGDVALASWWSVRIWAISPKSSRATRPSGSASRLPAAHTVHSPLADGASAHLWTLATRACWRRAAGGAGTVVRVERKTWIILGRRGGVEHAADGGAVESEHAFCQYGSAIHSWEEEGV